MLSKCAWKIRFFWDMLAALLKSLSGETESEKIQALRTQLLQAQSQFGQLLEAAISDTYAVWEVRHQWRRYAVFSGKLTESVERLWESLDALQDVDLHRLTSNLDDITAELNMRLCQVHLMLAGKLSEQQPLAMTIRPAVDMVRELPPLQKAALMNTHARLTELFQLTQILYDIVSNICGGDQPVEIPEPARTNNGFLPDPDGLKGAFFVMLNMWLAFLAITTIGVMFSSIILLVTYSVHIPFSNRPEKMFLRLLRRYFRSCQVLTSRFDQNPSEQQSWFQRILYSYHLREIKTLSRTISSWIPFIDPKNLPETTAQQIESAQISILALSYRMQELLEEQNTSHASGLKEDALLILDDWHKVVQQEIAILAAAPDTERVAQFRQEMSQVVKHFEDRPQYLFDNTDEMQNSEEDSVYFYQLLGACRGVSEALIRYAANASAIKWHPWHEERF